MKFQNLKQFLVKNSKNRHFFFLIKCSSRSQKQQKKILSRLFSPYIHSLHINFGPNYCFKRQKINLEEGSYFLNVGKKVQKQFKKKTTFLGNTGVGSTQFSDNFFLIFFYKNFTCKYFWTKNNENEVENVL